MLPENEPLIMKLDKEDLGIWLMLISGIKVDLLKVLIASRDVLVVHTRLARWLQYSPGMKLGPLPEYEICFSALDIC